MSDYNDPSDPAYLGWQAELAFYRQERELMAREGELEYVKERSKAESQYGTKLVKILVNETNPDILNKYSDSESPLIREATANNENTPLQAKIEMAQKEENILVIKALARNSDSAINVALAVNKSTPSDVLEHIRWDDNDHVLDLYLVKHDNTPHEMIESISRNIETSTEALEYLSEHESRYVVEKVAGNPKAYSGHKDLTEKLLNHESDFIKSQVVEHSPNITESQFEELFNYYTNTRDELKFSDRRSISLEELGKSLAESSMATPEMRSEFISDDTVIVREAAALSEYTPLQAKIEMVQNEKNVSVLRELSKYGEKAVRMEVAVNENTPLQTRTYMAENEENPDVLMVLSEDKEEKVRYAVANNRRTSSETVLNMAKNDECSIVLDALAQKNDLETNIALLENENTSSYALYFVHDNDHDKVLDLALANHNNTSQRENLKIASDPETKPNVLDALSSHNDLKVRMEVASNESTSTETIRNIFNNEKSGAVLQRLTQNENTPKDIAKELANDPRASMWEKAAKDQSSVTQSEEQTQEAKNNFFAELEAKRQVEKAQEDPHHQ